MQSERYDAYKRYAYKKKNMYHGTNWYDGFAGFTKYQN